MIALQVASGAAADHRGRVQVANGATLSFRQKWLFALGLWAENIVANDLSPAKDLVMCKLVRRVVTR